MRLFPLEFVIITRTTLPPYCISTLTDSSKQVSGSVDFSIQYSKLKDILVQIKVKCCYQNNLDLFFIEFNSFPPLMKMSLKG